jgi:ABC-type Fe3+-hydroxamate transport system substrate-binding protein
VTGTGTLLDDLGVPVPAPRSPARIASLVPNLSELVARWGLAERLVAVTEYCVEPADGFPDARRVRGTKNPDLDAIIALAPDLVLANEEENRELDVRRLRQAGLAVHVTRVRSLEELPASLERLGRVLDATRSAQALLAELARLERCDVTAGPRVACAVWRDDPGRADDDEGWWLLGRDTYGAGVVEAAGGQVVPTDPAGRYPRVPLRELRALAPDLVLLPDEPYTFGPRDVDDLAARGLRALRVDGRALWWWGTRTPAAVTSLSALLRGGVAAQ